MYHYTEYKKELKTMREEVLESSPAPPDGLPKGSGNSDPTADKAIQLSTSIGFETMERTIASIDRALELLSERHKSIFEMVYIQKRRDRYSMSDELYISYDTFNRNKNELVIAVGRELGAVKSF